MAAGVMPAEDVKQHDDDDDRRCPQRCLFHWARDPAINQAERKYPRKTCINAPANLYSNNTSSNAVRDPGQYDPPLS
jgi:hypothetical protein